MKNMEVFLHLQNRLPDLLDHRNTKLAVFFDGAQHSLAGPADFAIRSGRGAGLDVRKDGAHDGVVFLDGAKFSGVDRDHDLGQTDLVAEGPDGVDGIAAGKEGGDQIQQDGEAAALPVADGQCAAALFDGGGVCRELAVLVAAAGYGQLPARQTGAFQLAVAELAQGAVHHDVLAVGAGDSEDERVIADAAVFGAPGRHIGGGVRPADADAAFSAASQP